MQLLVTCDYLVSPSFCSSDELSEKVEGLIAIKQELDQGSGRVVIESQALEKLHHLGLYPCAAVFNKNMRGGSSFEFSGNDIARIVNKILGAELDDEHNLPSCVVEWGNKVIHPELKGCDFKRGTAINELVEEVSLASFVSGRRFFMLHYPLKRDEELVSLKGDVLILEPDAGQEFPFAFEGVVPIFSTYNKFAAELNGFDIYNAALDEAKIREGLTLGALSLSKPKPLGGIKNFRFGGSFIETLHRHQCGPGGRYSGTAFDAICHVIAGVPKYEHKPFYESINRKSQLTRNGKSAWRTHITKGNPALRLMYWVDDGVIELANIGYKKDLEIL